jgi:hypothetical protein
MRLIADDSGPQLMITLSTIRDDDYIIDCASFPSDIHVGAAKKMNLATFRSKVMHVVNFRILKLTILKPRNV